MGWLTVTLSDEKAALEPVYRLTPSFVVMGFWLLLGIVAFLFPDMVSIEIIQSYWLLSIAFGIPAILFVVVDAPGALIAATLSGITLLLWYFTQGQQNHTTYWLAIAFIINAPVSASFLYYLSKYKRQKTIKNNACKTCNSNGSITVPLIWLQAPYTGTCYICLGKRTIGKTHPHFEAAQILANYQLNLDQTHTELERLNAGILELRSQKQQGPETLGQGLYKQTLELEQKYHDQAALRNTQIRFYEQGLRKLHRMMYNSMLADNMLQKQKELTEMFDDNANDLGSVMSLKGQLEMHTDVIDRINALSVQIDQQNSTSIAKDLAKEIERMQADL